jgi:hypothetical protein
MMTTDYNGRVFYAVFAMVGDDYEIIEVNITDKEEFIVSTQ